MCIFGYNFLIFGLRKKYSCQHLQLFHIMIRVICLATMCEQACKRVKTENESKVSHRQS